MGGQSPWGAALCPGPHSGDPPLSFQFVPVSSPAPPPSTLTTATSAGRPTPTSAITPASSRPCRTTAPRPWAPKVHSWPGGTDTVGLSHRSSTPGLYSAQHRCFPSTRSQAFTAMDKALLAVPRATDCPTGRRSLMASKTLLGQLGLSCWGMS